MLIDRNGKTHRRHFLQQSNYTVSLVDRESEFHYASHEEAFNNFNNSDVGQAIKVKIILPATEQSSFLEKLQLMNINAFSLFGSEESLMSTLAFREFKDKAF